MVREGLRRTVHRYPCSTKWFAGCAIATTVATLLAIGIRGLGA